MRRSRLFGKSFPAISPNGRWLAHTSNETWRDEVYVRAFRGGTSGRLRVSMDGGLEPRWSRDGRTLFYRVNRTV